MPIKVPQRFAEKLDCKLVEFDNEYFWSKKKSKIKTQFVSLEKNLRRSHSKTRAANVNKSTISRIMTGKTHFPRAHLVFNLEKIFRQYASNLID